MKRDMDLIRKLLLYTEEHDSDGLGVRVNLDQDFKEYDFDTVHEHKRLLEKAGYLNERRDVIGRIIELHGLTWTGHDFLDSIRDEEIWADTKKAASRVGGFTVEMLSEIAKGFIKTKLKKHTGIDI